MKRKIDESHPLSYFLKSAREDMDLTQLDVMKLTGINNKTLSGYENGVSEPDFRSLAALARLYKISFDELLGTTADHNAFSLSLTEKDTAMLSLFKKLSPEKQDEMIVQIKALVEYLSDRNQ